MDEEGVSIVRESKPLQVLWVNWLIMEQKRVGVGWQPHAQLYWWLQEELLEDEAEELLSACETKFVRNFCRNQNYFKIRQIDNLHDESSKGRQSTMHPRDGDSNGFATDDNSLPFNNWNTKQVECDEDGKRNT